MSFNNTTNINDDSPNISQIDDAEETSQKDMNVKHTDDKTRLNCEESSSNSQYVVTNDMFGKSLDSSKLLSQKYSDDIQPAPEKGPEGKTENDGRNEVATSWDVAGTSQPIIRKYVRSKSWCGPRLNDDNTIDIRLLRERFVI